MFRVGPFVLMPAGDGEVPGGSGLKPKKDKVVCCEVASGMRQQVRAWGAAKVWSADGRRGQQLSLRRLLPAPLLGPQGQTAGSAALILPGAPLETAPHPEPGLTPPRAGLAWCSVAAAQSRGGPVQPGPQGPRVVALRGAVCAAGVWPRPHVSFRHSFPLVLACVRSWLRQ